MRFIFNGFLEKDEKIEKVFRRPVIFALRPFVLWTMLWTIITGVLWYFYPTYKLDSVAFYDLNLVWQFSALLGIGFALSPWVYWYVNSIVMTNESVVVIEWPKPFMRRSTRIDLHNLDEITTEKIGWKSFVLNFGDIVFNKVNGGMPIVVKNMSCPTRIARVIETYREQAIDQKNFTEESALKGVLSHVVRRHVGEAGQPERRRVSDGYYETTRDSNDESSSGTHISLQKKKGKPVDQSLDGVEFEKELDDTGGIDIDL